MSRGSSVNQRLHRLAASLPLVALLMLVLLLLLRTWLCCLPCWRSRCCCLTEHRFQQAVGFYGVLPMRVGHPVWIHKLQIICGHGAAHSGAGHALLRFMA